MHENQLVEKSLRELLDSAGFTYSDIARADVAGQTIFSVLADDARTIIGSHGDTIYAIDYLIKKIVEHRIETQKPDAAEKPQGEQEGGAEGKQPLHFLVDVNDYRTKQIKDLQSKARMMAERARSFQYDVELSPMTAYERLIVHTTLQEEPNIKTESQGEGRGRRVVIKYSAE